VLPSRHETWGVVLIEAMAAGLPAIVSDAVGSAPDLVETEETGLTYVSSASKGLVTQLNRLLSDPPLRKRLGEKGLEKVGNWSIDCALTGFEMAIRTALQPRRNG